MRTVLVLLRRWLRNVLWALAALVLLFEEWGWEPLARLFRYLARFAPWAWVERHIAALGPRSALLAFALPVVLLFPVKLLALVLFGSGHYAAGLALLLGAKVVSTALLARIFQLTEPALMQLAWFARWYPRWKAWKDALLTHMRQSAPWRWARRQRRHLRTWWKQQRS